MLYAYPGYMSFDSVYQLGEARSGHFSDGHPPLMAEMWRIVDGLVAGPFGMLVIQTVTFLAGAYFLFRRRMSARAAAFASCLLLWFPPIASVMAVIWKDSQMTAFLLLGIGLVVGASRRERLLGLAALSVGTAMRHNALVMTLPLVVLLFVWNERHGFFKRYAIAIVAWVLVTMTAQVVSRALTDDERYLWHNSIALCDITSTLRYTWPTIPDDELRRELVGTPIIPEHDLHAYTRGGDIDGDFVQTLWNTAFGFFRIPRDQAERDAVVRAWKKIVFSHLGPYLRYRWEIYRRVLQLTDAPLTSPIYNWFTDVQDPWGSAAKIGHDASAGKVQNLLRGMFHWLGATWVFHLTFYLILTFALLPFCIGDREAFALLLSGLAGEAILFVIAPTTDWRYSFWLVLAAAAALILLIARRAGRRHAIVAATDA